MLATTINTTETVSHIPSIENVLLLSHLFTCSYSVTEYANFLIVHNSIVGGINITKRDGTTSKVVTTQQWLSSVAKQSKSFLVIRLISRLQPSNVMLYLVGWIDWNVPLDCFTEFSNSNRFFHSPQPLNVIIIAGLSFFCCYFQLYGFHS